MTAAGVPARVRPAAPRARTDLRDVVAGIDPGLARLRLASVAVLAMMTAAGVTELLRLSLFPAAPVTVLLASGAVAMIANLAVNEPDLRRRRITTALVLGPALASTALGTLLAPYRVVADAAFVAVMVAAVWVRRYGPRGFALGQSAFITFFFTQFLKLQPAQLPEVLVAVGVGIVATLVLRGLVFAERPERTLRRLVAAFRARAHAVLGSVDDVLAHLGPAPPAGTDTDRRDADLDRDLDRMARARRRLNETAILAEDQLEQATAGRVWPGLENDLLALRIFDAELALERLTVAARRLAGPDTVLDDPAPLVALRIGVARMRSALALGTRHDGVLEGTADARGSVAGLCADTAPGHERIQRAAFAVRRVADAVEHAQRDAPARAAASARPQDGGRAGGATDGRAADAAARAGLDHDDALRPPPRRTSEPTGPTAPAAGRDTGTDTDTDTDREAGASSTGGLALTTRQAVQVGVATTLAIVGGELLAPSRWYWAVIAAFVVFANTASRGDLLTRGWGRIVGTIGGVAAGMGLAALVGGHTITSLVMLFVCVFLALYLVRISPGLLAFWITAVLALVYGLIGQFSVQVLLLRIEETAVGVLASVVAAFVILPRGTRDAFADSLGSFVDAADAVLGAAVDRLVGRTPTRSPVLLAREMDDALADLRLRVRPLSPPFGARRRGRSSYQRGLRVMVGVDHYARSLARLSDTMASGADRGSWAPTLDPAARAVRANLDALRDVLSRGRRRSDGGQVLVTSAEEAVDAAEAFAARSREPHRRADMLTVARMLRRTDQAVVSLAADLGAAAPSGVDDGDGPQEPSSASSAGFVNTRAGS